MQTTLQGDLAKAVKPSAGALLLVQAGGEIPQTLLRAAEQLGLNQVVVLLEDGAAGLARAGKINVAVIAPGGSLAEASGYEAMMQELAKLSVPILVLTQGEKPTLETDDLESDELAQGLIYAAVGESCDMFKGRLATLLDYRPMVESLTAETQRLRTVSQPLSSYFSQMNEEMRLASRLQRDFLPRELPQAPGVRFATVFRPASWVSGDIYDVARLDEEHVGFYIADAVGHGMPAALLTMYIKRALVGKVIEGDQYRLIEPGDALARLNEDMVTQEMSNFQFATCCYALLNTRTLCLRVASAGHPAPLIIDPTGQIRELDVSGSLLGVFAGKLFETHAVQLHRGEKLLLYSDGVELAFVNDGPDKPLRFRKEFDNLADCDIRTMCDKLLALINNQEGSLHPRDDVTILGLELFEPPSA